jgi:hypothetical protein
MTDRQGKGSTRLAQAARRRSQRIPISKTVELAWHLGDGTYVTRQAETEVVSAHGALLRTRECLPAHMMVALRCSPEAHWEMARVIDSYVPRSDGWTLVAVELAVPNETFWGVLSWSGV